MIRMMAAADCWQPPAHRTAQTNKAASHSAQHCQSPACREHHKASQQLTMHKLTPSTIHPVPGLLQAPPAQQRHATCVSVSAIVCCKRRACTFWVCLRAIHLPSRDMQHEVCGLTNPDNKPLARRNTCEQPRHATSGQPTSMRQRISQLQQQVSVHAPHRLQACTPGGRRS